MHAEEKLAEESLGLGFKHDKPAMIFATYPPGTDKRAMAEHTSRFQALLQSGAIRTTIFQSAEDQWCITAYDPTKAHTVRFALGAR